MCGLDSGRVQNLLDFKKHIKLSLSSTHKLKKIQQSTVQYLVLSADICPHHIICTFTSYYGNWVGSEKHPASFIWWVEPFIMTSTNLPTILRRRLYLKLKHPEVCYPLVMSVDVNLRMRARTWDCVIHPNTLKYHQCSATTYLLISKCKNIIISVCLSR